MQQAGWEPYRKSNFPDDVLYEILTSGSNILPPGQKKKGRLFIITVKQPLKIFDMAEGKEGDLTDVDYHKLDTFRKIENMGYDGVKINDFAQVHRLGNVGHHSVGIFKDSLHKLDWKTMEATHPDEIEDFLPGTTTPEFEKYKSMEDSI